jgi:hypothetical protein
VKTFTVEKMNPCSLRFSLLSLTACLSCVFFFLSFLVPPFPPLGQQPRLLYSLYMA